MLLSIASKNVISTLDDCHGQSFAITTGVKVGGSSAKHDISEHSFGWRLSVRLSTNRSGFGAAL